MSGTLEEAFAKASADINNNGGDSEEETVNDEVKQAPKEPETTDESAEGVDDSSGDQDSFTKVSPDELPDELKGTYKSLQADYTRKTQELAKMRKEIEQERMKLKEQGQSQQEPSGQPGLNQQRKQLSAQEQLQQAIKQEIDSAKIAEFRESAIRDYEAADPRLNTDSDEYSEAADYYVGQKLDAMLQEHVNNGNPEYTFDHQSAIKKVLSEWDDYLENIKKDYLKQQQEQAKEKQKELKKKTPQGKTQRSKPRKPTLEEAIKLAEQDLS